MSSEPSSKFNGAGLETLLRQLGDAVEFVDPLGRVLLTNRAEELPDPQRSVHMPDLGDTFQIFRPDGRAYETDDWPVLRSLRTGEMIADEEFFRLAPDGTRRSFSCSSAPIRGEDGTIVAAVVVARDVSEQKRSREQLAYLLPMLDQTEDAIIAFDPQWRLTAWNKGAERMYGRSAEEALGRELESFLRVNVTDEQFTEIRRGTAERGRWRDEVEVSREDGWGLSVEAITVAIRAADGGITGYFAIHRDISERKRAEEAVREARRRAETILENFGDKFSAVDREWRYTYINEPALAQARSRKGRHFTAGDVLGMSCWEFLPELVGTTIYRELHRAMREQRPVEFEAYSQASANWLELRVYPSDEGLSIFAHDITQRKQAEEQLRYHASLLDSVEDGVVATDADDFRITAWNRGAEKLYGFSAAEVLGRAAREVASFPGDEARLKLERELLEAGQTRIEFRGYRKDGSAIEVELIAVAVKDKRGETSGYLGIHRDITGRKRAVEQLAHHASLLENLDDAVLGTDADFVLTIWNRGAQRMFGWTAAEALGHKVNELIPTSFSDEELAAEMGDLVKTGRWRGDATWYGKHGKPVEAESLTVAVRSDQGHVSGYVSIMRDIADLSRATRKLETTAREQALLADLSLRALSGDHLQALLDGTVTALADVLEVELSSIAEVLPAGRQLIWRAAFGCSKRATAGAPASQGGTDSLVGYTLVVGKPVISVDVRADRRFSLSPLLAECSAVSAAAVVIPGPQDPFGVLVVAARTRRSFGSGEIEFMQAVATLIGIAIDRANADERIEAGRQAERARIARDLHDEVLRELTDALALATIARSRSADDQDMVQWGTLITSIQNGARHLRSAIYDLRLNDEDRPFGDLLSELIAIQNELADDCQLQLHGRDALGAASLGDLGTEVLRVVTEALTNSRRHSGATTIRVDAGASTTEVLRLEVSDDGAWPDREFALRTRAGTGIRSMFHRADVLGAKLQIEGQPEDGTTVSLELALTVGRSDG